MSSTRLQDLYARALARRDTAPGTCVAPEDLLALVRREGPEARRLEILDHVMACAECSREFALLRSLEAAGQGAGSKAAASIGRWLAPLALAASILLAVGVGLVVRQRAGERDIPRGGVGNLVLLRPPSEMPPGQPITFTWTRVPAVERYRLEVLNPAGDAVISQLTPDTSLTVPAGQLRAGVSYRWWVRDAGPGARLGSTFRPLRIRTE